MMQNKNLTKSVICMALGVLVGVFVLSRLMHVGLAAALGAIVGSFVAQMLTRSGARPSAPASSDSTSAPPPAGLSDAQVLNEINLRIRSRGLAPDLIARVETLIDRLSALLPTLGGQYSGFELTWQIQRIANTYLPKLVDAYVALTDAQRTERRGEFDESLRELEEAVARTVKAVDEKNTAEFSNVSAFLKFRFS